MSETDARALAVKIVSALLDSNALWPHPYDPRDKADAIVTQILAAECAAKGLPK